MTIASTERKAGPLSGNGSTTSFPFSFKVFATGDIKVGVADSSGVETILTENVDYTVALNANQETSPGGTVTYPISGSPLATGSVLSIIGDLAYDQPLDLPSGGNFSPLAIENQLDRVTIQVQQLKEQVDRSAKLPQTSTETPDTLVFNTTRLAESADNLDTVASSITNVNTVATSIADVNTTAAAIGSVVTTAANIAAVNTVASDLNEPVSEINTVATNITNVNTVGNNIANVNTVAGISANVTSVAGNATNINTVATDIADVSTVAGSIADVNAVAADIADVSTVAGIAAAVSTVATNVADVTNFADVYQGGNASNPTLRSDGSALQAGDLYFNTSTKRMRVYDGAVWIDSPVNTASYSVQTFSGDGSTVAFTLTGDPVSENNTQVYIGGVYQSKSQYSLAGSTLTFSVAPPTGSDNIEVVIITTMAIGTTTADLVTYGSSDVEAALNERVPEIGSYALLRAYAGSVTSFLVRGVSNVFDGGAGVFRVDASDTTSADNGGTIIVDASGRRWKRDYSGAVNVKWFGAQGNWNGITGNDDTAAIKAAHAASSQVHYPSGKYKVNWTESTALVSYSSGSMIRITGDSATLFDTRNYTANSVSAVFQFTSCTNVVIDGLNYEGNPIADKSNPTTGIGYLGATFVNLSSNCSNITVNADLKYLRYGIRAGDYSDPTKGENNNIKAKLTTLECGYPVALYLTTGVDLQLYSEGSHRTAYLAGVRSGRVCAYFKNQYIAPIQVLVTDATTNGNSYPTGTSRGCSDLDIVAHDLGSTIWTDNSFAAGISMSRGDAGTVFENIKFDVSIVASDTVASKLSAFCLFNNFTPYQPSYPDNWSQSFYFRNIKVSGLLDRSAQTVTENSANGEIYIYGYSSGSNYCTASGIDISGFRYLPGGGSKPRGFYYVLPGLQGISTIENCDFGTATPFLLNTNATSLVSVRNTTMQGSASTTSDSPFLSNVAFTNCNIANMNYQPFTNKSFTNTTVQGAGTQVKYLMNELTLTGASVTWSGALPNNSIILGVSGRVTQDITGATGFLIGTATTPSRFLNTNTLTAGTSFTPSNSSDTSPQNQVGTGNIIVTAKTSNFTAGKIRLQVAYMQFTPPTS